MGVVVIALAGCRGEPMAPIEPAPVAATTAGLRPGDAIALQIWREPDLSGTYTIDDRGFVTFPLLGDRRVEGRDAEALRDDLLRDFRAYLQNPSIELRVLRRVTVLGAVNAPGVYSIDPTVTLRELLGLAGGVAPLGNAADVRLLRGGAVLRRLDSDTSITNVDIRSGDEIIVGEKSWLSRSSGALLGSLIAAAAVITTALIR